MKKPLRLRGQLSSWKDERGFGFITPKGGGKELFVHISAFSGRDRRPAGNEAVTYLAKKDAQGRPQAYRVWFDDGATKKSASGTRPVVYALTLAGIFLAIVAGLVVAGKLPPFAFPLYFGSSLAAFITYAWDKSAARRDRWRTAESTLHLLSLVGGWPGALVARHIFRHKSKKQPFVRVFWITAAFNIVVLIWLLTPPGQRVLNYIMDAV